MLIATIKKADKGRLQCKSDKNYFICLFSNLHTLIVFGLVSFRTSCCCCWSRVENETNSRESAVEHASEKERKRESRGPESELGSELTRSFREPTDAHEFRFITEFDFFFVNILREPRAHVAKHFDESKCCQQQTRRSLAIWEFRAAQQAVHSQTWNVAKHLTAVMIDDQRKAVFFVF